MFLCLEEGIQMKSHNRIINISWEQFYEDCAFLARLVKNNDMQDATMIVVSNGGLYVGGLLGRFLNNDKINTVGAKRRKVDNRHEVDITYFDIEIIKKKIESGNKKILIVDDIYDSGSTIAAVHKFIIENCYEEKYRKSSFCNFMYATPYFKAKGYGSAKDINPFLISPLNIEFHYWIKYPWEKEEK